MRNKIKIQIYITGITLLFGFFPAFPEQADSLSWYLETAARNNPLINSNFALYKASLEKIPQAGAYADPELDIGLFVKPMETLSGKQIADFTLMQMFPWFGTRKAARNEATEMSRMAYEQFREARNNLFYEVKSQWYQLCNLNEQYKNTQANLLLLEQLEKLALNRYSAPSANAPTPTAALVATVVAAPPVATGNSMDNMGGMGNTSQTATQGIPAGNSSMQSMGAGSMGASNSSGSMSDVLRIQIEKAELQNNLEILASNRIAAEARFNALLNRKQDMRIAVPDSLEQLHFLIDDQAMTDSIITANPMLSMLEAEANAYRAKAVMDKKMSYPMFGIGLQYSLVGKSNNKMVMDDMNGMDMFMPMFKISIPIFRKKYQAQQKESQHYRRASELKYENTLNELQSEYQTVKQQLADAARKIALYKKQQELSLSTWQLIVREFSAGTTSLTDVIQVERQLLDYGLKKSEAIAEYNTMVAGLEKLVATSINE
ncbi:TolC family protein [Parabacteroides faecis]|uniref:TolC family protein n=1 Tax=Parabacteroides faecis TaxID=1217282 RepID=UPI003520E1D1